jgi:hypothetical protein
VFHVEIRQRPHVARAFNLSERELRARFVDPLAAGKTLFYADREWEPRKTKLLIYEGPELTPEMIGMGRGWGNVSRSGTDVTDRMLHAGHASALEPSREQLKDRLKERLVGRLGAGPLPPGDAVELTGDLLAGHRASERLALTELAIWELLHGQLAALQDASADPVATVPPEGWEAALLRWDTWTSSAPAGYRLIAALKQVLEDPAPGSQ